MPKLLCDICRSYNDHITHCPKHFLPKALFYCSSCGEGIYDGEEYIDNHNGEYRHFDCIQSIRDLVEWLGYDVEIMDDKD